MSKPKISTKTRNSYIEKEELIIKSLSQHLEGLTPKFIALYTRINVNTIKSILKKLEEKGEVTLKDGIRGFYILVENSPHSSIFDWNFHNAQLNYSVPEYGGNAISETFEFGLIRYDFNIGKKSKQANIHIITEHPIPLSTISVCFSYFSLLIQRYTGCTPNINDINVSCIEFNQDYANLRLEGASCITLTDLLNQFKIYQKENGVRIEYKLTVPIKPETIFSLLNKQGYSLSLLQDMNLLKTKQESIEKSMKNIKGLLSAILNKLSSENE